MRAARETWLGHNKCLIEDHCSTASRARLAAYGHILPNCVSSFSSERLQRLPVVLLPVQPRHCPLLLLIGCTRGLHSVRQTQSGTLHWSRSYFSRLHVPQLRYSTHGRPDTAHGELVQKGHHGVHPSRPPRQQCEVGELVKLTLLDTLGSFQRAIPALHLAPASRPQNATWRGEAGCVGPALGSCGLDLLHQAVSLVPGRGPSHLGRDKSSLRPCGRTPLHGTKEFDVSKCRVNEGGGGVP